jgi:hypothetical protein
MTPRPILGSRAPGGFPFIHDGIRIDRPTDLLGSRVDRRSRPLSSKIPRSQGGEIGPLPGVD